MNQDEVIDTVFSAVEEAGISRDEVVFVYLFGSFGTDEYVEDISDIDICISFDNENPVETGIKVDGRLPKRFDLSVFQDLPLYIRKNVLDGELLYSRSKDEVYDTAFKTLREFESFEPVYREAIGAS